MTTRKIFGMEPMHGFLLLGSILFALGIGYVGSMVTTPAIGSWYQTLTLPSFTPPSSVFGPVWTTLYVLMGIAAFRVWKARMKGRTFAHATIALYAAHLGVNLMWSFVFFGARNPEAALVVIGVLLALILVLTVLFFRFDRLAGMLMLPYLAWVGFATALNASIASLN